MCLLLWSLLRVCGGLYLSPLCSHLIISGAAFVFETALLVLTLLRFFSSLRENRRRYRHGACIVSGILPILARDGTWAFGVIFCMSLPSEFFPEEALTLDL
jgi:hypothetical protein